MICCGIVTNHFLECAMLLRINAPNMTLYNTHGVGDKGDNPFLKDYYYYYYYYYYLYILLENIEIFLLFYMYILYYFYLRRRKFCYYYYLLLICTGIYLFIRPRKWLLLATNLLDLSLGLHRGRPIWATFIIEQQIVWGTNCKPCPFLFIYSVSNGQSQ
jgi:hypothetical protein